MINMDLSKFSNQQNKELGSQVSENLKKTDRTQKDPGT